MAGQTVLAVDLGAEAGRVTTAHYDGSTLQLEEPHRFSSTPVSVRGTLYWDIFYRDMLKLWGDVQDGILERSELKPAGLGVDAWGVDFGLLERSGELVGQPVDYREVLDILLSLTGEIVVVQIVGGGSQNKLLNQLTANATGVSVVTRPVEATVLGNAAVQLMSTGTLSSLTEARQVIKNSAFPELCPPQAQVAWQEAYHRYQNLQKATA